MGRFDREHSLTNTFINKVLAERQVLKIVNSAFPSRLQLAGLSASALEAWRTKASLPTDHSLIESLIRLGTLIQTLSNRSNESFNPIDPSAEPEICRMMTELPSKVSMTVTTYGSF